MIVFEQRVAEALEDVVIPDIGGITVCMLVALGAVAVELARWKP